MKWFLKGTIKGNGFIMITSLWVQFTKWIPFLQNNIYWVMFGWMVIFTALFCFYAFYLKPKRAKKIVHDAVTQANAPIIEANAKMIAEQNKMLIDLQNKIDKKQE